MRVLALVLALGALAGCKLRLQADVHVRVPDAAVEVRHHVVPWVDEDDAGAP